MPASRQKQSESIVRNLFEVAGVNIGGNAPGDIRVKNPAFYERLLRDASIGLGESYMDDWWEVDALDVFIDKLMRANIKQKIAGSWKLRLLTAKALLLNLQSRARSGKSVEAHYDIGNDLYTRMLDPRMVYTCGYWKNAKTLAEAQEAKLELIAQKAGLQPGMKVLDLGCGWGGFAAWAAEKHGCDVVGYTLSKDQVSLGKQLWKGLSVDMRLSDYREATGKYDRVISIGMMEHVGPKNHRTVMKVVNRCLKDDGVAVIHTIANNKSLLHGTPFIEKYIFPNAVAPSLAQLGRAIEGLFVAEDLQNIGPDYDPTLMAWWANFDKTYSEISHKYDRRFYQMWKFYLLAAAGASRSRDGQLYHLVLTKTGRAQPDCRKS
ncbi:MAG: cyclopropane fatty acyl phospholipid synthase [Deltaproteobacteria bacterium]|nr:cyclopropane fatty acyl phospholipid synthase [Deltaproteobacteria bacterium]